MLLHVDVVDEAAAGQFYLLYLLIDGRHTVDAGTDVVVTVGDVESVDRETRARLNDDIREVAVGHLPVSLVELDVAVFLIAFIWLRGVAAVDDHRVGHAMEHIALLRVEQSIAGAQQHNEHEDAPGYGKARERRSQFVAAGSGPDLF